MFSLDFQSRQPIYEQLYRSVAKMAALGALAKNEALPSVRALAQELGVNPNTVQKAYSMLERDGIICSVPGKGSLIAGGSAALEKQKQLAAENLRAALREARESGLEAGEISGIVTQCIEEGNGND